MILIFPIQIRREACCGNCNEAADYNEIAPEFKSDYRKFMRYRIPPIWHFLGVFVIIGAIGFGWYQNDQKKEEMRSRVESLDVGRIIEFKTDSARFSLIKICKVDQEKVYGFFNNYEVETQESLGRIKLSENYSQDTMEIDRESLFELIEEGKIIDIYWGTLEDRKKKR